MAEDIKDFFQSIQICRVEYRKKFIAAFREGLDLVSEAKDLGKYIGNHYDFPKLHFSKNGLPNLTSALGSGPIDYSCCFSRLGVPPLIEEDTIESFLEFVRYVRSQDCLRDRFGLANELPAAEEPRIEIDKIQILSTVKSSIDRYIHKFDSFEYNEETARDIIDPAVSYIFDEKLRIEIYVPILFLDCCVDKHELANGVSIRRLSDDQHQARYKAKSYNISAHQSVINSATHALVLENWEVQNTKRIWDFNILDSVRAYPIDTIDQFFGALRICSMNKTGYGQVYSVSKGWEHNCTAALPCVRGATTRSYPALFEDYYWDLEEIPTVSTCQIEQIATVYEQLSTAKENSISLAVKRLNRCLVRDDEEDAVLDATIALEALLSDDGNQEMTHKLAMRVGALASIDASFGRSADQAFSDIKKIYGYRSAIVHGSKDLTKKRLVKIDETTHTPAYELSIRYVRFIVMALLANQRFRDPKTIDRELLLGVKPDA